MTLHWLAAGTLAAALFTGCKSAPPRWASARVPPPDPDRWERAMCQRGEYPVELDARALARARYEDLRARHEGASSPFAAARLESGRSAFDERCAALRTSREEGALAVSARRGDRI